MATLARERGIETVARERGIATVILYFDAATAETFALGEPSEDGPRPAAEGELRLF